MRSYKVVEYKSRIFSLTTHLRTNVAVLEANTLDLWCGESDLRDGCFIDKDVYGTKGINFGIRFRQYQEKWRPLFVWSHNVEVFAVPPACCGETFVSVTALWARYDSTRLLYVLTPPLFSGCSGVYGNCRDDQGYIEMITSTENELITLAWFFMEVVTVSYFFCYLLFDHYCSGILVSLQLGMLEVIEVLRLYFIIHGFGNDAVLCSLPFKSLYAVDWL